MIVVPRKLRLLVEEYLRKAEDRGVEQGGYFFGTKSKFVAFMPCPNFSKTPWSSFDYGNGKYFAREFARMVGYDVVATMHTHPNGTVPSEADLKYFYHMDCPYHVVIADMGEEFKWFVVDRMGREIGIVESDEELERLAFFFAEEVGLEDLGRVFLTPSGELLVSTPMGRALLQLDEDALKVLRAVEGIPSWKLTKAEVRRRTGLSLARVDRALKKLKNSGVIK